MDAGKHSQYFKGIFIMFSNSTITSKARLLSVGLAVVVMTGCSFTAPIESARPISTTPTSQAMENNEISLGNIFKHYYSKAAEKTASAGNKLRRRVAYIRAYDSATGELSDAQSIANTGDSFQSHDHVQRALQSAEFRELVRAEYEMVKRDEAINASMQSAIQTIPPQPSLVRSENSTTDDCEHQDVAFWDSKDGAICSVAFSQ